MYLTPFIQLFPEQGARETRSFKIEGDPVIPDDEYALFEAYCTTPSCHCRRVMLNVVSRLSRKTVASISYSFADEQDLDLGNPFLDPLNPQGPHALALLHVVEGVLKDKAYVERLRSHYYQVKGALADPESTPTRWLSSPSVPVRPVPGSTRRPKRKPRKRR